MTKTVMLPLGMHLLSPYCVELYEGMGGLGLGPLLRTIGHWVGEAGLNEAVDACVINQDGESGWSLRLYFKDKDSFGGQDIRFEETPIVYRASTVLSLGSIENFPEDRK